MIFIHLYLSVPVLSSLSLSSVSLVHSPNRSLAGYCQNYILRIHEESFLVTILPLFSLPLPLSYLQLLLLTYRPLGVYIDRFLPSYFLDTTP